MNKPVRKNILAVPKPSAVEFVDRPHPRMKPGCVLVKTKIAAVCVEHRMCTDHIHEWFDHPLYGVGHDGAGTVVITHEFPMTEAKQAFRVSASHRCGKILLYSHSLPSVQGGH